MPLHVSSTMCSSSGGQNCIIQHLVSSHTVGARPVHRSLSTCVVSGQQHAPAALYPRERPGTHIIGGWVGPGPVWTGRKSRPHRDSIPDRPARSQSLYRLSYRAHNGVCEREGIVKQPRVCAGFFFFLNILTACPITW